MRTVPGWSISFTCRANPGTCASRLGGVTPQALRTAESRLRAAELSPALQKFLVELPFWVGYLKRTFSRGFEQVNEPYDQRLQAVFDQGLTLDDASYRDQMNEVLRSRGWPNKQSWNASPRRR